MGILERLFCESERLAIDGLREHQHVKCCVCNRTRRAWRFQHNTTKDITKLVCRSCVIKKSIAGRFVLRDGYLRTMGFSSYAEYLGSTLWKSIRSRVVARDRSRCRRCGGFGTDVHHRVYSLDALLGKNIGTLVLLCRKCHTHGEFENGRKVLGANAVKRRLGKLKPWIRPNKKAPQAQG